MEIKSSIVRIEHKVKIKEYIKEFNSHIRHYFYHIFLTLNAIPRRT